MRSPQPNTKPTGWPNHAGRLRQSLYAACGVLLLLVWHRHHVLAPWDLSVYYSAARAVWQGLSPYPAALSGPLEYQLTDLTVYVYPPLWARLLSPFSLVSEPTFVWGYFFTQTLAIEAIYWLGLRLSGKSFSLVTFGLYHLLVLFFDPLIRDLIAGNTALLETIGLLSWALLAHSHSRSGSLVLGTLIAIKPFTLFYLLAEILGRRWRAVIATGTVVVAWLAVMLLDHGFLLKYLRFTRSELFQSLVDEHTVGIYNHATVSVMHRLFTEHTLFGPVWVQPTVAIALSMAVPIGVWLLAGQAWQRHGISCDKTREQQLLDFNLLVPTVLLTVPRVADYTLVVLLIPLFFGSCSALQHHRWVLLLLYAGGLTGLQLNIAPVSLEPFTLSYHWLHHRYAGLVLIWLGSYLAVWISNRNETRLQRDSDQVRVVFATPPFEETV